MSMTNIRERLNFAGRIAAAAALVLVLGVSGKAVAYDEPHLNLGLTSFLDGGLPAGPGVYALQYLQFYTASKMKDEHGANLSKMEVSAVVPVTQLAYMWNVKIGSAHPGVNLVVPWPVSADAENGLTPLKTKTGLGDITIATFLQFDPIMGANGPLFVHRIELAVLAPTGAYDPAAAGPPGGNFWSFNPSWAATLHLTHDWTVSSRIHYLWNGKNDKPSDALKVEYPDAVSSRAGQAFHMNFASEYAITKELRIGVNGYYLQQTTDTEINGIAAPGRKERVAAIGPGFAYCWGVEQAFFFNAYKEFDAINRPEGESFVLRYAHHF
jgi:hypothetical protein